MIIDLQSHPSIDEGVLVIKMSGRELFDLKRSKELYAIFHEHIDEALGVEKRDV